MSATGLLVGSLFVRFAIPYTHISENFSGVRGSFLHPSTKRLKSADVDFFIPSRASLSFDADSRNSSGESVAKQTLRVFSMRLVKSSAEGSFRKPIRAMASVGQANRPARFGLTQLCTALM